MSRIWDIVDKIQPGVEITRINDNPVRIAKAGAKFMLSFGAGVILATTSAFCMPVPSQTFITSAAGEQRIADAFLRPPLQDKFASYPDGMSPEEEAALLAQLDGVSLKDWHPSEEDVRQAIATNMSERPGERTKEDVARLLRRRKLA
jgi:hypothetical protein